MSDTIPYPSPEETAAREERARVAFTAYASALHLDQSWDELEETEREAWRCASDAAYRHVVVTPA